MDWNEDGKIDLLAGDETGAVWVFINSGTAENPKLDAGKKVESNGKPIKGTRTEYKKVDGQYKANVIQGSSELAQKYSKLHWADWNGDGLKDLLIGHTKGEIVIYFNKGKKGTPEFGEPKIYKPDTGNFPLMRPSPYIVDWDKDGKKDLLLGSEIGEIYFYPNKGTSLSPRFVSGEKLKAGGKVIKKGSRARIDVVDWNNDGKMDLLLGDFYSKEDPSAPRGRKAAGNVWLFLAE